MPAPTWGVIFMTGDDAYVFLILMRNKFLKEKGIFYGSKQSVWYWGTASFAGNPKLNAEFVEWYKVQGLDYESTHKKALKKESPEWLLEQAANHEPKE